MKIRSQRRMVQKPVSSPMSPSSTKNCSTEKKRSSNFSRDEVRCLVMEYKRKSNILNFGTREQMQRCWEDITASINDLHYDFSRSVNEVKKKWVGLLHDTKKQYYKAVSDAETRRDGKRRMLSEIAEMIIKLKGGFSSQPATPEHGIKVTNVSSSGNKSQDPTFYVPSGNEGEDSDDDVFLMDSKDDIMPFDSMINKAFKSMNFKNDGQSSLEDTRRKSGQYPNKVKSCGSYPQAYTCNCSPQNELVALKQESLALKKRKFDMMNDLRLEKQKLLWEKTKLVQLKKQKLELEIKYFQANYSPGVFKPINGIP